MQGSKVELPSGYAGVIMAGEGAPGTGTANALKKIQRVVKAKTRGTKTRASRNTARDDEEMDEDAENGGSSRTLLPTAQFSSFVLWHPDIPVDSGRDEYLRSLTEWVRLADEVGFHFFFLFPAHISISHRFTASRSKSIHSSPWKHNILGQDFHGSPRDT
jgi:ribonuclease H2 subunit C